jgi:hypothetical protein
MEGARESEGGGNRGRRAIRPRLVLPEWLEAGLVGACAVALLFFLLDSAAGDPLRTPAVLGTLVVRGFRSDGTPVVPGAAVAYHFLHFAAWIGIGLVATRLVRRAEDRPTRRFGPLAGAALFLLALMLADLGLAGSALGRGRIALGGLVGVAAVAGFLLWRHPGALERDTRA